MWPDIISTAAFDTAESSVKWPLWGLNKPLIGYVNVLPIRLLVVENGFLAYLTVICTVKFYYTGLPVQCCVLDLLCMLRVRTPSSIQNVLF